MMKRLLFVLSLMYGLEAHSEKIDSSYHTHRSHFSIYAGAGYSHYFNNMVLFSNGVKSENYAITMRAMWEPRHRLSVGIETGYMRVYRWNSLSQRDVFISLHAMPITTIINMRIYKGLFMSYGFGSTLLINTSGINSRDFRTTQFTIANITAGVGYKWRLNKKWSLVVESDFLYISKADDKSLQLFGRIGYTF